jgi:hypothetical protein
MVYNLLIQGGYMLDKTIEFKIKECGSDKQLCAIEFYRPYTKTDGTEISTYIDTSHAMNKTELLMLKNFLQEYLQNNDWD